MLQANSSRLITSSAFELALRSNMLFTFCEVNSTNPVDNRTSYVSCFQPRINNYFFNLIANCLLPTLIALLGVVGNVCLLLTMTRTGAFTKQLKPFLGTLALNDLFVLTVGWTAFVLPEFVRLKLIELHGIDWLHMELIMYPIANIFLTSHIWSTSLLTYERYLATCRPIWHRTQKPRYFTLVSLVLVWTMAIVYNIVRFFEVKLDYADGKYGISPVLPRHPVYYYGYSLGAFTTTNSLIPIGVMSYCTWSMMRTIRTHNRTRSFFQKQLANGRKQSSSRRQRQSARKTQEHAEKFIGESPQLKRTKSRTSRRLRFSQRQPRDSDPTTIPKQTFIYILSGMSRILSPPNLSQQSLIAIPLAAIACYSIHAVRDIATMTIFIIGNPVYLVVIGYIDTISRLFVFLDASCNFYAHFIFTGQYKKHCKRRMQRLNPGEQA